MIELAQALNTVIQGDALQVLRDLPADAIDITVTSPPYNKRNKSQGWLVGNKTYSHFDDEMAEDTYQAWQVDILNELLRVTRPGGSVFYNHKVRWEDGRLIHPLSWVTRSQWHLRQEIIWDRTLAANVRGWRFWQVDERIYWLYKPIGAKLVGKELQSRHGKFTSIWRMKPALRMAEHPAPFPLELPVRAIYSMPGDGPKVVLDPFSGTGTTLVAAHLLGHDYIGVDISPDYVEYARNRIAGAEAERNKLAEEIARHVIDDPFAARKQRGKTNWPNGPKTDQNGNDSNSRHNGHSANMLQSELESISEILLAEEIDIPAAKD